MTLATVGRKPCGGFELSSNMTNLTVVSNILYGAWEVARAKARR